MRQKPPESHKKRGLQLDKVVRNRPQLLEFVSAVKNDADLDFQIRPGYFNIYYRGGCLLSIRGLRWSHLTYKFDDKYFVRKKGPDEDKSWLPDDKRTDNSSIWLGSLLKLKDTMDGWFDENNNIERQLQQQISSNSTRKPDSEWVFLDVEYAAYLHGKRDTVMDLSVGSRQCKFDLIAVKGADLASSGPLTIYVVELKQGHGALAGKSGIIEHAKDLHQFISSEIDVKALDAFKASVKNIVREKSDLGLLPGVELIADMDDMTIKGMFLLYDCSNIIIRTLQKEAQDILGEHSASPLFWKLTKDNFELVEY